MQPKLQQDKSPDVPRYLHLKATIEPPPEFLRAYERLREANYSDPWLLDTALPIIAAYANEQRHHHRNSPGDEICYLWALCLQAEILDYYEKHKQMRIVLETQGNRLKNDMEDGMLGAGHIAGPSTLLLRRQQLWLLVLYAHSKYRSNQPQEARQILEAVRRQVNIYFPLDRKKKPVEPSYGLRARIAYSLGQVLRHLSDLSAREEFMTAIYFARQRLLAKTEKYGYCPEREQKYATFIIAKSFVFGLAWASFQGGELKRALGAAAAGSALLESSNDPVHRAYAHAMHAQVLSAIARPVRDAGPVPSDLQEAIDLLEPLADWRPGQKNRTARVAAKPSPLRIVPKLLSRTRYVLANAYFAAGRLPDAEELAREVYDGKPPGRWRLECAALLVRILLVEKRIDEAETFSGKLLDMVKEKPRSKANKESISDNQESGPGEKARILAEARNETVTDAQRAEAYLCHVDVLLRKATHVPEPKTDQLIEKQLEQAARLSEGRPLLIAMCIVQRGRYYMRLMEKDKAREQLALWDRIAGKIENGYIEQMGADFREDLAQLDDRLVIERNVVQGKGAWKEVEKKAMYWTFGAIYATAKPGKFTRNAREAFGGVAPNTLIKYMKKAGFRPPANRDRAKPAKRARKASKKAAASSS